MLKKTIKFLVIITCAALSLTGCSGGIVENDKTETVSGAMFIRHELADAYSILEDCETGVCYLEFDTGFYRYGITVMLNPDGTPRTWDEMEGQDEKAKSE